MASTLRIRGEEVTLSITDPQGGDEVIGPIRSFEATLLIEILEEDYLGEVATQYDDIFNGAEGTANFHLETTRWFRFSALVQRRAGVTHQGRPGRGHSLQPRDLQRHARPGGCRQSGQAARKGHSWLRGAGPPDRGRLEGAAAPPGRARRAD